MIIILDGGVRGLLFGFGRDKSTRYATWITGNTLSLWLCTGFLWLNRSPAADSALWDHGWSRPVRNFSSQCHGGGKKVDESLAQDVIVHTCRTEYRLKAAAKSEFYCPSLTGLNAWHGPNLNKIPELPSSPFLFEMFYVWVHISLAALSLCSRPARLRHRTFKSRFGVRSGLGQIPLHLETMTFRTCGFNRFKLWAPRRRERIRKIKNSAKAKKMWPLKDGRLGLSRLRFQCFSWTSLFLVLLIHISFYRSVRWRVLFSGMGEGEGGKPSSKFTDSAPASQGVVPQVNLLVQQHKTRCICIYIFPADDVHLLWRGDEKDPFFCFVFFYERGGEETTKTSISCRTKKEKMKEK